MTTIVLADDHPIVRQGLGALLKAEPDLEVIGEASDGLEASQVTERLRPNVLVLDIHMPFLSGLEVARQVRRRSPGTRIVILSMYANETYVLEALQAGAVAYVLKEATAQELVRAVRDAAVGRRYLSPPLTERAIEAYVERARATCDDPYEKLTDREREVLQLVAQGCTSASIAELLCVGRRTVETHRANLMRKLGLRNQAELIRYAIRRGIAGPL